MATKKYENAEKVTELLGAGGLKSASERLLSSEKQLSDILKKLSILEEERDRADAEEKRIAEEQRYAEEQERAAKAAEEQAAAENARAEAEREAAEAAAAKAKKEAEEAEKAESKQTETPAQAKEPVAESAPAVEKKPAEKGSEAETTAEEKKTDIAKEVPSVAVNEEKTPDTAEKAPSAEKAEVKEPAAESKAEEPKKPSTPSYIVRRASDAPAASAPVTRPAGAKRPPMRFVNGQAVGVYVAKPGTENNDKSSYRPGGAAGTFRRSGDKPFPPKSGTGAASFKPRTGAVAAPVLPKENTKTPSKKKFEKTYVEKRPVSRYTLQKQQGMTVEDFDEDKTGYRKVRLPKKAKKADIPTIKIEHAVVTTQEIPLKVLSEKLGISAVEITKRLFKEGIMKSINDSIDYDNAALIALDMGIDLEYKPEKTAEEVLLDTVKDEDETKLVTRAPVVTVMGHVDHGKTSLLDKIRSTSVTEGEAGGITQSIGAYTVTAKGKQITFIDTPGHAAFTSMRARGAKVTDIVVLVVAADDGIMPQTVEAINHAQAAGVPMVFAINKIDKPNANPDHIKEQLSQMNYLVESWGGKYQDQEVSAKKGLNLDKLLEKVLLEAEMLDLKANPNKKAQGTVIESTLDKGRGYVSTILVQSGTLRVGDVILSGTYTGRVKAMFNENGKKVEAAGPSTPVQVLGLNGAPQAGDTFNVMDDDRSAREIANKREQLARMQGIMTQKHVTLDEIGRRIAIGSFKELNIIVKGDVDGSVEAMSGSLIKLSKETVQVNVIHAAVGQISESDVLLAAASNAIIVGFQVRPSAAARKLAEKEEIEIRLYSIIYDAINDIKDAIEGMLEPVMKEEIVASVEVLEIFKITKVGTVAGCMVREGKLQRSTPIRVIRDGIVIYTGKLGSLKRFKDDVKEVVVGQDCGLNIESFNDIRVGDIVEGYEQVEVKRK